MTPLVRQGSVPKSSPPARSAYRAGTSGRRRKRPCYPVSLPFAPPPGWTDPGPPRRTWPTLVAAVVVCLLAASGLLALDLHPGPSAAPAAKAAAPAPVEVAVDASRVKAPETAPDPAPPPAPPTAQPPEKHPPAPDPAPAPIAASLPGPAGASCRAPAGKSATETYGTSVNFMDDPVAAARVALKDRKLLFVLHVAGNFEDDRFT
jgi:hypothetical protein